MTDILELNGVAIEGIAASLPESFIDNDQWDEITNLTKKKQAEPEEAPAAPEPSAEEKLLTEIRDLLKNK